MGVGMVGWGLRLGCWEVDWIDRYGRVRERLLIESEIGMLTLFNCYSEYDIPTD